jgi:hypothetical protein
MALVLSVSSATPVPVSYNLTALPPNINASTLLSSKKAKALA